VIAAVEPLLLVTANDMFVLGDVSLLNPIAPGLINIVCDAVEITSAITPEPGVGSAPSALLASAVLAAVLT
jgi:hypothetical protein